MVADIRTTREILLALVIAVAAVAVAAAALVWTGGAEPVSNETAVPSSVASTIAPEPPPATTTTTSAPLGLDPERTLRSAERPVEAGCEDPIAVTPPAGDLASTVAAAPIGTCFRFEPGTYAFSDVEPKDYMTFLGDGMAEVVVQGTSETENAFHGTATGVTIARLSLVGFQGDGGESRQEQAPIRGTSALWKSDRGEMATEWLVEEVRAEDNHANGIFLGDHFTVRNSILQGNGIAGLGGSELVGGLVEGNLVSGNGREQAGGYLANGGGMKFTQAASVDDPLTIRGNEVFDNTGIGIWCDIACDGVIVSDNYVHDETSRAVMIELSSNATIRGNFIVEANTWSNFGVDFNAGAITVGESRSVLVEGNYVIGGLTGVAVRQTRRPVLPQEAFLDGYDGVTFLTEDVVVRDNLFTDVQSMGVSLGTSGGGLLPAPDTIVFEGNRYAAAELISFWGSDGVRQSLSAWQAAGRDVTGGKPFEMPEWARRWLAEGLGNGHPATAAQLGDAVDGPVRIDAGGPGLIDDVGEQWQADEWFIGGEATEHAGAVDIGGTDDDDLYRTERWGLSGYRIPVVPGRYLVVLHHAEVYADCQLAGCRVFGVSVEGQTVSEGLDIFAAVGGMHAYVQQIEVDVVDGMLDVSFQADVQNPQLSGLEVLPVG